MQRVRKHWHVESHGNKWVKFCSTDWDVMYRAGGNEEAPKFVLQSLVDLYWAEVAKDVYKKLNTALLHIDRLPIEKNRGHTACFVSYHKPNDNDKNEQTTRWMQWNEKEIYDWE